jgi:AraC-like DNA-binding protein
VLSRSIADLEQRLADCDSFALRAKVADAFLTRRIRGTPRMDRISFAAHQIVSMSGQVRVADLSTYVRFSTRQFEREFGSRFGMRPKLYSRIVRFQAALDSKARSSTKSWTDVAHEFGYYDQMHMIHDFEQFTGANRRRRFGASKYSFESRSKQFERELPEQIRGSFVES